MLQAPEAFDWERKKESRGFVKFPGADESLTHRLSSEVNAVVVVVASSRQGTCQFA